MRRPPPNRSPTSPDEVVEMFLHAYRVGAFPMADIPEPPRRDDSFAAARTIRWYSPDPRAIVELSDGGLHIGLHIGRTIARDLRRARFALTSDRAFERVIRACTMMRRMSRWRCGMELNDRIWPEDGQREETSGIAGAASGGGDMGGVKRVPDAVDVARRNNELLKTLRQWRAEDAAMTPKEQEEARQSWEALKAGLNENNSSGRRVFP